MHTHTQANIGSYNIVYTILMCLGVHMCLFANAGAEIDLRLIQSRKIREEKEKE